VEEGARRGNPYLSGYQRSKRLREGMHAMEFTIMISWCEYDGTFNKCYDPVISFCNILCLSDKEVLTLS